MVNIDIDESSIESSKRGVFKDGIHYMENEEYHELDGISSTNFAIMEKSQAAFEHRKLFPWKSESFVRGDLWHTAVLEPDKMDKYMEASTTSSDSVSAKKLAALNPDKTIVGKGSIADAKFIAKGVHTVYHEIFDDNNTRYEVTVLYNSDDTGMLYKARPDVLFKKPDGTYVIFDLKSTKEENKESFAYAIEKYNYDLSAAWYIDTCRLAGIDVVAFGWICVPISGQRVPYAAIASAENVEIGRQKYNGLLGDYLEYKSSGVDPRKYEEIFSLSFMRELNKEIERDRVLEKKKELSNDRYSNN